MSHYQSKDNSRDVFQERRRRLCSLELAKKCSSVFIQRVERFLAVHCHSITRDYSFLFAMHYCNETILFFFFGGGESKRNRIYYCGFSDLMEWMQAKWERYRSVVGSGPMRWPGKGLSSMYSMNDVLPVEYWPSSKTWGLASKSLSLKMGEWNSSNLYFISKGWIFSL